MKTILALVDFSDITERVVSTAADTAKAFAATLYLVHVAAPDPEFIGYDVGPQTVRKSVADQFSKEHRAFQAMEARLKGEGVVVHALLVQGPTLEKIFQEIKRLSVDLVVMGSHGHSSLHNLLVGSVTEGVLRQSPCPVLVVPRR